MKVYNHDFPYHDYETDTTAVLDKTYIVGENNKLQGQKKLFVSKSTLIICTEACHVHFNEAANVMINIIANVPYTFYSNIHAIYYGRTQGQASGTMHIYVEGVLPQEARRPE